MGRFINRESDIAFLKGEYEQESASLVILYGR